MWSRTACWSFSDPSADSRNFIKNVFDVELPEPLLLKLKEQNESSQILRVTFVGDEVMEPIIADLATRFSLRPSVIFYRNITQIKETVFGSLLLKLLGDRARNCLFASERLEGGGDRSCGVVS